MCDQDLRYSFLLLAAIVQSHLAEDASHRGIDTIDHGPTAADQVQGLINEFCDRVRN